MNFELLNQALSELETVMKNLGAKLIIGGGFGLYLWQTSLDEKKEERFVISRENWCVPRATIDLDMFLETTILAELNDMQTLRTAIGNLGYIPMVAAQFMHFEKSFGGAKRVEINFLTGPIEDDNLKKKLKISRPRVRPRGEVELHAYLTDEALGISENLIQISKAGALTASNLFVPHPATLLLMKLHAFRDRYEDIEKEGNRDKAQHHAVDVYRIICMLDQSQFIESKSFLNSKRNEEPVVAAAKIIEKYFSAIENPGCLMIQEHPLYRKEFDLDTLRSVLGELLPV